VSARLVHACDQCGTELKAVERFVTITFSSGCAGASRLTTEVCARCVTIVTVSDVLDRLKNAGHLTELFWCEGHQS
jgi:hypothetical protein